MWWGMASAMLRPTPVKPVPPPLNSPEGRAAAKAQADAQQAPPPGALPPWRKGVGAAVPWLASLFLFGLAIQVFLAGFGLQELGGQGMDLHVVFSHVIEFIPLLLILCGVLGGDRFSGILGIVLFVLFGLQYAFLEAAAPSVRALHPANAAVMVAATTWLVLRRPFWRRS